MANAYKRNNLNNKYFKELNSLADKACALYPQNFYGFKLKEELSEKIVYQSKKKDTVSKHQDKAVLFYRLFRYLIKCDFNYFTINITKDNITSFNFKKMLPKIEQISDLNLRRNIYIILQQIYSDNETYLLRLAEIYANDEKIKEAHIFLSIACNYTKGYLYYKKLAFELEHNMLEEANETFLNILQLQGDVNFKYFSMLLRVSVLFTREIDLRFAEIKNNIENYIENYNYNSKNIKSFLINLLKIRKLDVLKHFLESHNFKNKATYIHYYNIIAGNLKNILDIVHIASKNEECIDPLCITNTNEIIPFEKIKYSNKKLIEFYIPSIFFSTSEDEKPTYNTVREFYRNLYDILHAREDVVLIPLHQYNWRFANNIIGEFGISYHTHSDKSNLKWLHIQESVLNARCSIDHKGFAGFSSLALTHNLIDDFCKNVDIKELKSNYNELYSDYVEKNISKYDQNTDDFHCSSRYIFIPMQVRTDIVSNIAYISCLDLLRNLLKYLPKSYKLVVKRHPYCNSLEIFNELMKIKDLENVILTDCSVHSILKNCDAVFTANSGVGFEALMHKKSVYVTGLSDYNYAVSKLLKNEDDIKNTLQEDFYVDELKILKLLYFYKKCYTIDSNDICIIKQKISQWLK